MRPMIDYHRVTPDWQCLVVGCKKKALYRNPNSHAKRKDSGVPSQRGYCSDHRTAAFQTPLGSRKASEGK